jgi:hypothetical protein
MQAGQFRTVYEGFTENLIEGHGHFQETVWLITQIPEKGTIWLFNIAMENPL